MRYCGLLAGSHLLGVTSGHCGLLAVRSWLLLQSLAWESPPGTRSHLRAVGWESPDEVNDHHHRLSDNGSQAWALTLVPLTEFFEGYSNHSSDLVLLWLRC